VIYLSVCTLLAPFQKYLEISVVFGLSIYTATTNSSTVGNENVLKDFGGMGGRLGKILYRRLACQ